MRHAIPRGSLAVALAAIAVFPACTRTPPRAPADPIPNCVPVAGRAVTTFACAFTSNIANFLLTPPSAPVPPGRACAPGSMLVSGVTVSGTDTLSWGGPAPNGTIEDDPSKVRIRSVIPNGTGTFVVAPVDPTDVTCTRTVDPPTTIPFTWTATHAGRVDRSVTPNCTFASNITFGSLTVSPVGGVTTPRPVDAVLRDSVHVRVDALVADRVDAVTRGAAHTDGVGIRCASWAAIPTGA